MTNTKRFAGRTAIITGASRGIGAGIAERLAAEGADIAITARTYESHPSLPGSLKETAERCEQYGNKVEIIVADLADEDSRAEIVPIAVTALGPIDILVNNAAAAIYQPIHEYPLKRRRLMTEINIQAPIDLTQAVLPGMIERGQGWIVNVSSGSARLPDPNPPYDLGGVRGTYGFYGATKAMLNRLTQALASENHHHGVRVNTIEPKHAVMSEGADKLVGDMLTEDQIESLEAMVEATLILCDCDRDHTGRIEASLDLLDERGATVMTLDGAGAHPGGYRR
ncbi:MAG: SDR family NAD(P)-dependent oxidoreductase [Acidimicrobiales bacterium]|nr:SDR family NAD(P)-dependent oxidoreductase [Acidimicrobiales bacterium]